MTPTKSSYSQQSAATDTSVGLSSAVSTGLIGGTNQADIETLRLELQKLQQERQEIMQLLGTVRPDRVVHDIRNLIQERIFLEVAVKRFGG